MKQVINSPIGDSLKGKDAQFAYDQYAKRIDNEIAMVRAKMRVGLVREQYDIANKKIEALLSAKMILKSVQIFHAE